VSRSLRLAEYVREYGPNERRILSHYSWFSLHRNEGFWVDIESAIRRDGDVLSLRGFDRIYSHGMTSVALLCDYIRETRGVRPALLMPAVKWQAQELCKLNFDALDHDASFFFADSYALARLEEEVEGIRKKAPAGYCRITPDSAERLFRQIDRYFGFPGFTVSEFTSDLGLPLWEGTENTKRLWNSLKDLILNVLQHSSSRNLGGQGYFALDVSPNRLHFTVADSGVGIRESLSKRGIMAEDSENAIRDALELRYRHKLSNTWEEGLFGVAEWVFAVGGKLLIRSADASVELRSEAYGKFDRDRAYKWVCAQQLSRVTTGMKFGFGGVQVYFELEKAGDS